MRRLSNFVVAFAAAMSVGTSAFAAGIYFQTVAATATSICVAPCFQVQMFAQDTVNGTTPIQAIQFDINVVNSDAGKVLISDVVVANLPVPPATNGNAQAGNANVEDDLGNIAVIPFELSATVGKSPQPGFDALVVDASAFPTDVSRPSTWVRDHAGGPLAPTACTSARTEVRPGAPSASRCRTRTRRCAACPSMPTAASSR